MEYLLKYSVGEIGLATPIDEIREIVRPRSIDRETANTRSRHVVGSFYLRDQTILLYDLPGFLGVTAAAESGFEVIIANIEDRSIGFKVTKVHGIIHAKELMPFPDIVRVKDYFRGVVRDNGSFLQVLSLKKLLSGARLSSLRKLLLQ